jgi:hypothetical protein
MPDVGVGGPTVVVEEVLEFGRSETDSGHGSTPAMTARLPAVVKRVGGALGLLWLNDGSFTEANGPAG